MTWFRITLSEEEQELVKEQRLSHPDPYVRRRMWVLWLLHCGATREQTAEFVVLARSTVERFVVEYRDGGLGGLCRRREHSKPTSDLAAHGDVIRKSFEEQPVCTVAEAGQRIYELTGIRRSQSQIRRFMRGLGLTCQRVRAIPVPPKKTLAEHAAAQATFHDNELKPRLDQAQAGVGHVFFVDAAHFVFGTFLCCLWSFTRIFVRAASGRQRFNVLGAWNAVTRQFIAVTNTTVVNTETMCELLRKIAAQGLVGPITIVLDNARYQRNAVVEALAASIGIKLLFLPSYSPNLNLIERLWKFIKRRSIYGRYHPTFAEFRAAIEETIAQLPTTHAASLASLMTLNFQRFENVSLMAA